LLLVVQFVAASPCTRSFHRHCIFSMFPFLRFFLCHCIHLNLLQLALSSSSHFIVNHSRHILRTVSNCESRLHFNLFVFLLAVFAQTIQTKTKHQATNDEDECCDDEIQRRLIAGGGCVPVLIVVALIVIACIGDHCIVVIGSSAY